MQCQYKQLQALQGATACQLSPQSPSPYITRQHCKLVLNHAACARVYMCVYVYMCRLSSRASMRRHHPQVCSSWP